jgi:cold shock CspA family protein
MKILEVSFREVDKNEGLEELIRKKAAKLDQACGELMSCRIAVEKAQQRVHQGNPFRVRIDMTVPGHEFVVVRDSGEGEKHAPLSKVISDAFSAARRKLREHVRKDKKEVKTHPMQEIIGYVTKLFREKGYGFLKTDDDRELYFHQNSVLHGDFDRLEIGTGVRYAEEMGDEGPQASTVTIVNKPGAIAGKAEGETVEPPLGWRQGASG